MNIRRNFLEEKRINTISVYIYYVRVETMSDIEKYDLIMNIWTPPADYKFPESKGRKFLYNWLRIFPNLCYSKYLDGAFCLSCVLFGRNSISKSSLKNLYTAPLTISGC